MASHGGRPRGGRVPEIPDRTVVLTFDGAHRSHLAFVAPELQRRGLRATFFATAAWRENHAHDLSFAEIAEIARMGFEIGSHSAGTTTSATPQTPACSPPTSTGSTRCWRR